MPLQNPQEHGTNRPHRLILGSWWGPKTGTVGSQDPEIIKDWWAQDPIANIGIVTAVSPLSRVLIIDIDADIRDRQQQPQARIRAGGSHGHSASELPPTEWFLGNGFRPGQRNEDCHRVACRLWYHHLPNEDRVHSVLYQIWQRTKQSVGHPFTWSEA